MFCEVFSIKASSQVALNFGVAVAASIPNTKITKISSIILKADFINKTSKLENFKMKNV